MIVRVDGGDTTLMCDNLGCVYPGKLISRMVDDYTVACAGLQTLRTQVVYLFQPVFLCKPKRTCNLSSHDGVSVEPDTLPVVLFFWLWHCRHWA